MKKTVDKVWGKEEILVNTRQYCSKFLHLNKGFQCSLHYHKLKDETFYILSGRVSMEVGGRTITMLPDMSVDVPHGAMHRFTGLEDSVILETSTQDFVSDSYRIENSREASHE